MVSIWRRCYRQSGIRRSYQWKQLCSVLPEAKYKNESRPSLVFTPPTSPKGIGRSTIEKAGGAGYQIRAQLCRGVHRRSRRGLRWWWGATSQHFLSGWNIETKEDCSHAYTGSGRRSSNKVCCKSIQNELNTRLARRRNQLLDYGTWQVNNCIGYAINHFCNEWWSTFTWHESSISTDNSQDDSRHQY